MPRYRVEFMMGASTSVDVELDVELPVDRYNRVTSAAEVEAIDQLVETAEQDINAGLCFHCARKIDLGEPDGYEPDGSPVGIYLVED